MKITEWNTIEQSRAVDNRAGGEERRGDGRRGKRG